jgi:ferredoxin
MGEGSTFRLELDESACVGHGRCYVLAPEIFEEDDDGHCVLKRSHVAGAQEEAARRGVANCPEDALKLVPEN